MTLSSLGLIFPIGTKLTIMSGLGISLVAAMIGSSAYSNSKVSAAISAASAQQEMALDLNEVGTGIRYTQGAVREIPYATNAAEVKKSGDSVETRSKTTFVLLDKALQRLKNPENRERVQKVKDLFTDYTKGGKEIAQVKGEQLNPSLSDARKDALNDQMKTLQERVSGASKMMELADASSDFAKVAADKAVQEATWEMDEGQYLGWGVGTIVILLLIGSAIFGVVSIARPLPGSCRNCKSLPMATSMS